MTLSKVTERANDLRTQGVPFVHARVVRAERPTSAKPGDQAVVFADGTIDGFVGGSCAESTVRAQALTLLDSGQPLLLRITPTPDVSAASSDGTLTVHNPCLSGGTLEIFLEPVLPLPRLVVRGESPIAQALRDLGHAAGFDTETEGSAVSGAAAVVVASHGRDEEAEQLQEALDAKIPYVGLVASRVRGAAVLASLDIDAADQARIHTPAGLDIGARTPAEVAVSILAQIVGERRRPTAPSVPDARTTAEETDPLQAIDPVCGMTVAAVERSLHFDHEGTRYYFCGTGCLRAFAADPASYSPA